MPQIQLIADAEYQEFFTNYLNKIEGIELKDQNADVCFDLSFLNPEQKLERLSSINCNTIVSNTLTVSATKSLEAASHSKTVVGIPVFPFYFERQTSIEYSLPLQANGSDSATSILQALGKTTERIQDSIGGVFPRTLAMIINEAAFALQESVASVQDIDSAMKLGTNYPKGPLAWCDEISPRAVVAVLDALAREYGSDRYRVASLLRRHAEANLPFYA